MLVFPHIVCKVSFGSGGKIHGSPQLDFRISESTNLGCMSALSVRVSHTHPHKREQGGGLPGAGCGVCGGGPLLAALHSRVVHPVAGQQCEDEVRRLGAEVGLTLHLTGLSQLTEPLIIHTCRENTYCLCRSSQTQGQHTTYRLQPKPSDQQVSLQ